MLKAMQDRNHCSQGMTIKIMTLLPFLHTQLFLPKQNKTKPLGISMRIRKITMGNNRHNRQKFPFKHLMITKRQHIYKINIK